MIQAIDLGVRGGAIVLIAFIVLAIPRAGAARPQGWIATAFGCGVAAYLLCSSPVAAQMPWALRLILSVGCLSNPWLLWLFSRSIFSDGFRFGWRHAGALAVIVLTGTPAYWREARLVDLSALPGLVDTSWMVFKLASVTLAVLALLEAWRGRASDLVERRRVLRTYFISIGAAYMLLVLMAELYLQGRAPPAWLTLLNGTGILAVAGLAARQLLAPRFDLLLDPIQPPAHSPAGDPRDEVLLDKLQAAIHARAHHREGLTIAGLAAALQTQEYILRPLINERLGFRNFNDFLHRHRLSDACKVLADPSKARIPILSIALEVGYGSIGPFNRAFRALTGETPSAYRRRALGKHAHAVRQMDGSPD